jgi:hypothetical protein
MLIDTKPFIVENGIIKNDIDIEKVNDIKQKEVNYTEKEIEKMKKQIRIILNNYTYDYGNICPTELCEHEGITPD